MSELNKEDVTIGLSADGEVLIMTLPIKKYALDEINGKALIYGKMRELQAHCMQVANEILIKKSQNGLYVPKGGLPPDIRVH